MCDWACIFRSWGHQREIKLLSFDRLHLNFFPLSAFEGRLAVHCPLWRWSLWNLWRVGHSDAKDINPVVYASDVIPIVRFSGKWYVRGEILMARESSSTESIGWNNILLEGMTKFSGLRYGREFDENYREKKQHFVFAK